VTLLDEIIDGSTSDGVSTPNVLRKVQVAATRLGADAVVAWARSELTGYTDDAALPDYRADVPTLVIGTFTFPLQQFRDFDLTPHGAPRSVLDWFTVSLRQPITELEALSQTGGDSEPARLWPPHLVNAYEESGALRLEWGQLYKARNVLSRQGLAGVVETVRTRAMEFALELQKDYPDAGAVNGPTLASEPGLATVVYHVTNNITGHGTTLAVGDNAKQRTTVHIGDSDSLLAAAQELGLSEHDAAEFAEAVRADGSPGGPRTTRFLERVRRGAITLAGDTAADVAASGLIEAARAFLGG